MEVQTKKWNIFNTTQFTQKCGQNGSKRAAKKCGQNGSKRAAKKCAALAKSARIVVSRKQYQLIIPRLSHFSLAVPKRNPKNVWKNYWVARVCVSKLLLETQKARFLGPIWSYCWCSHVVIQYLCYSSVLSWNFSKNLDFVEVCLFRLVSHKGWILFSIRCPEFCKLAYLHAVGKRSAVGSHSTHIEHHVEDFGGVILVFALVIFSVLHFAFYALRTSNKKFWVVCTCFSSIWNPNIAARSLTDTSNDAQSTTWIIQAFFVSCLAGS